MSFVPLFDLPTIYSYLGLYDHVNKHGSLHTLVTGEVAPGVLGNTAGIVAGWERASEAAKDEEKSENDKAEDDELPESGVTGTVIGPSTATGTCVLLELVCSELVVDETTKSDRVAEELQRRNRVAENEHGSEDEEDIF